VATLDGTVYRRVGGATSPNQLSFDIMGQLDAPAFGAADFTSVTTPFTLTGLFRYGRRTGPTTTADLFGGGLATVDLVRGTGALADSWVYQGVRYDFSANAVPTPEPSSLLLLATGALLVGAMRLRRRRILPRT
jgi:hypothetical protein